MHSKYTLEIDGASSEKIKKNTTYDRQRQNLKLKVYIGSMVMTKSKLNL
jgi:hypothetical protein